MISRKQKSLARKMHNKIYHEETITYSTNSLNIFRMHYKTAKTGINKLNKLN